VACSGEIPGGCVSTEEVPGCWHFDAAPSTEIMLVDEEECLADKPTRCKDLDGITEGWWRPKSNCVEQILRMMPGLVKPRFVP